jgi:hypothetical protein
MDTEEGMLLLFHRAWVLASDAPVESAATIAVVMGSISAFPFDVLLSRLSVDARCTRGFTDWAGSSSGKQTH